MFQTESRYSIDVLKAHGVRDGFPRVLGGAVELKSPGEVEGGRGPLLGLLVGVVLRDTSQ